MLTDRELRAATLAYQRQLELISLDMGGIARRAFVALGKYDRVNVRQFIDTIEPFVIAAGNEAAASASAYIATISETPVTPTTASVQGLAAPLDAPFLRMWKQLKTGVLFDDAATAGASVAENLGKDIVQRSARRSIGTASSNIDGIAGWRRVLTGPSNCEWCALVSTQRYRTNESATFGHDFCDCTVVPILGDRDPGRVINGALLDRLDEDDVGNRLYENRLASDSRTAGDNAARRRDRALDELAVESDPERRERLRTLASRYDADARRYHALAAKQSARQRQSRPDGSTGYVDSAGNPVPRPT